MPPNVGPSTGCNTPQGHLSFRKRETNRKTFYFMTLTVTKEDVKEYFVRDPRYKKVNGFQEMRVKIYI